jgi:hypothetical protein
MQRRKPVVLTFAVVALYYYWISATQIQPASGIRYRVARQKQATFEPRSPNGPMLPGR